MKQVIDFLSTVELKIIHPTLILRPASVDGIEVIRHEPLFPVCNEKLK